MTAEGQRPAAPLTIAAFAAVYVIWGSTFLAIHLVVAALPPFLLAGARFTIAGAVLCAMALASGAARPTRANWRAAAIVGILLFPCGNAVVFWAETRLHTGTTALLVATEPLWIVVLLWLQRRARPRPLVLGGVVAGFIGLVVLVGPAAIIGGRAAGVGGAGAAHLGAALAVVAAACAWALGSVYARSAPLASAPLLAAGMESFTGGVVTLVVALAAGEQHGLRPGMASRTALGAFAYLVVFGSLVGFASYSWLLKVAAPARVATYAYVNPVIAVLLGWAILGETITWRVAISAAIIIGAVVLIIADQSRAAGVGAPIGTEPRCTDATTP
ncbi:MAG TPA: EamA family transporter [Gemmatimonadaceae bacterium]|nr:EamA family transporter [Gemmatimonadaceae bacterium]